MAIEERSSDLFRLKQSVYASEYIISQRDEVGQRMSSWKRDIRNLRAICAGNWSYVFGGGPEAAVNYDATLKVQNLVKDALDDAGRRVAESMASVKTEVIGGAAKDHDTAMMRAAIATGYDVANNSTDGMELLGQDLAGDGAAFMLHYADGASDYPCHSRFDPIGAFPILADDELVAFIYVRTIIRGVADKRYPELNLRRGGDPMDQVEVIEYYTPDEVTKAVRAVSRKGSSGPNQFESHGHIVEAYANPLGKVPVSWGKVPTKDGAFRGLLNQTGNVTNTINRLMTLIIDNMEQNVYAPLFTKGVVNPEDYGPGAILEGDPAHPNAEAARISPTPLQGGLFNLLGILNDMARGGAQYPSQRGGQDLPSIVSASGIQAVQGGQVSLVGSLQRAAGMMRRRGIEVDCRIDETFLDYEKDLLVPAGNSKTYLPSKDIAGKYRFKVNFGLGSELDPLNRSVFIMQAVANRTLSRRTGMENLPNIENADAEMRQQYLEGSIDILFQRMASAQSAQATVAFAEALTEGKDTLAALTLGLAAEAQAQQEAMQAQAQLAAPQGQPALPPGVSPEETQAAVTSAQKGGVPGTAEALPAPQPAFSPPPFANISTG